VGFFPDITSADPQASNELPPLYLFAEGLTSTDASGKVVPFLAESWTVEDAGRSYTFTLRPNVTFHNGRKMRPEDIQWSILRVKNPATAAFRQADMRLVEAVTPVGADRVRVTLSAQNSSFPALLVGVFVIAPESVGAGGRITRPIATGPFEFADWQPGDRLVLRRFPQYWQLGIPKVDEVVVRMMSDNTARVDGLRAGDLDLMTTVPPQVVPVLKGDRAIRVASGSNTIYSHVTFNLHTPTPAALGDVRVRRAIALSLDKSQLVSVRQSPSGQVDDQPYRAQEFWYADLPDAFAKPDTARARALLQEAGAGTPTVELITLASWERMAEVIQQQLRPVGIQIRITSIPDFATFQSRLTKYDYGLLSDTGFPRDDPSQVYAFWESGSPSNIYRGGFQDPQLDQLLVAARTQPNPAVRRNYYRDALKIITDQRVATVIYAGEGEIWAYRTRLANFQVGRTNRFHYSGGGLAYVSIAG
jgi:peptide/nickel transport system substrate-binding protein